MDARIVALALTLLAGCAAPPDFVTCHGVAFYLQGTSAFTREQAELLEHDFLRRLDDATALHGPARERCLQVTRVVVTPEPFSCSADPDRTCAGEQYGPTLKIAARDCPFQSAYVHELLHWLQECSEGLLDYAHESPAWTVVNAQLEEARTWCAEPE
ncbi:MAG: hypothetical protein ACK4N5_17490 [Myxococcales bacterium]